jgi:hypothetical protein
MSPVGENATLIAGSGTHIHETQWPVGRSGGVQLLVCERWFFLKYFIYSPQVRIEASMEEVTSQRPSGLHAYMQKKPNQSPSTIKQQRQRNTQKKTKNHVGDLLFVAGKHADNAVRVNINHTHNEIAASL